MCRDLLKCKFVAYILRFFSPVRAFDNSNCLALLCYATLLKTRTECLYHSHIVCKYHVMVCITYA